MTTTTFTRAIAGNELRLGRALAVTERNATLLRSAGTYGWLMLSGLAEPLLYLFALGWGVGTLVGDISLPNGRTVPYFNFVAPALLAFSAMSGALGETTINFFAKLRFFKQYDSVLNTPVTPGEVAFGELCWATLRGGMYSAVFLVGMAVAGMTTPPQALLALPAALLLGFAFGGVGLALSTYMRGWQDFEYVGSVQFALFMFSGTFVPITEYPLVAQVIVQLTPLYHGLGLIRGITLGQLSWSMVGNAAYLLVLAALALIVAARRMQRLFWK